MPLQQAFSLTPRESRHVTGTGHVGHIEVHGVSFWPKYNPTYRYSLDPQHSSDELCFPSHTAGDGAADYSTWDARRRTPHVRLFYDLSAFTPFKEVALTFRFDAASESRILVYTDAGLVDEETLNPGDDQFLLEVESTDALNLYFVHATAEGSAYGGYWFFRGIDAYIA